MRSAGFDRDVTAHVRRGGLVLGVCGGYQMLGRRVADPDGIEGRAGTVQGLGLLDVETVLSPTKSVAAVRGTTAQDGVPFAGYEMHIGTTEGPARARPFGRLADGREEGAVSADGRVFGTYIHGLFAADRQRSAWLARLGGGLSSVSYEALIDQTLDRLGAHIATHVDLDRLVAIARS